MSRECIGFLHPGAMGAALAVPARQNGHTTLWLPDGRSPATRERARAAGLTETDSLDELCKRSTILVSVCPPHAARQVADLVATQGYRGIYVDANAIAPDHARMIATAVSRGGAAFVDASIIGPPPDGQVRTFLYLSGCASSRVAECLCGSSLEAKLLGPEVGRASALKMCHSAVHKAHMAMLFNTLAAADGQGILQELMDLFSSRENTAVYLRGLDESIRRTPKAWRFAGEMKQISAMLEGLGLPAGFHQAADEVFQRLSGLRDTEGTIDLQTVLDRLIDPSPPPDRADNIT